MVKPTCGNAIHHNNSFQYNTMGSKTKPHVTNALVSGTLSNQCTHISGFVFPKMEREELMGYLLLMP